jgi:CDP-diglyceride synthetase
MDFGVAFFIILILIVAIWVIIEFKRMRHKLFAIFLIGLILFLYITVTLVIKQNNLEVNSVQGVIDTTRVYFSWLGSVFGNLKDITSNVINMDWSGNKTN